MLGKPAAPRRPQGTTRWTEPGRGRRIAILPTDEVSAVKITTPGIKNHRQRELRSVRKPTGTSGSHHIRAAMRVTVTLRVVAIAYFFR